MLLLVVQRFRTLFVRQSMCLQECSSKLTIKRVSQRLWKKRSFGFTANCDFEVADLGEFREIVRAKSLDRATALLKVVG